VASVDQGEGLANGQRRLRQTVSQLIVGAVFDDLGDIVAISLTESRAFRSGSRRSASVDQFGLDPGQMLLENAPVARHEKSAQLRPASSSLTSHRRRAASTSMAAFEVALGRQFTK